MLLKEMIAEPCNTLAMSEEWIVGVKEEGCSIVKVNHSSSRDGINRRREWPRNGNDIIGYRH